MLFFLSYIFCTKFHAVTPAFVHAISGRFSLSLPDADAWKTATNVLLEGWWMMTGCEILKSLATGTMRRVHSGKRRPSLMESCVCTDGGVSCMRHQSVLIRISCLQAHKPRPRSRHLPLRDFQMLQLYVYHLSSSSAAASSSSSSLSSSSYSSRVLAQWLTVSWTPSLTV